MARPIPITNQKAADWNEFLVEFNRRAESELPQDSEGNIQWELLDKNEAFGNYSGGQDFYQKVYNDVAQQKGWLNDTERLQESDFPVIQQFYQDLYNTQTTDPEYFKEKIAKPLEVTPSFGIQDASTYDPFTTRTGKGNQEGWVGSVSRMFYLPMNTGKKTTQGGVTTTTNENKLVVPASFNEGESYFEPNPNSQYSFLYSGLEKGGPLSPEKARKILHDGFIRGEKISDKQRRFFGGVASGYIKWKGGKLYAQGGKMCYEDGGPVEYEDSDIEAVMGGELEEISEDVVEVKGEDHNTGGVQLNTGDEVEGGETIDKKKAIVYSDTLIDPVTKKTFAEAHKEMAKEMRKLERGTERWEKRKLAKLKERAQELYNRQQEMNGDGNGVLEDGGGLGNGDGPGAGELLASKQDRYFKVDNDEYTVSAKDADAFLKQFPTAKEYKKVGENFIEATSPLLAVGQKKNKLGEATTISSVKSPSSTDWNDLKTLLPEQQSDISNAPTIYDQLGGMDMTQHKEAIKEKYEVVKDDFNDWIEPLIGEQRKEMIFDIGTSGFEYSPFSVLKPIIKDKIQPSYSDNVQSIIDQENPEDIRLWTGAARQRRDDVNMMIGNKLIEELINQEEVILISEEQKVGYARQGPKKEAPDIEYQGKGDPRTIFPENVETSFGFDVALEDLFSKYKGQKIELADGTVFDTNKITPSQLREIDAYVKGNYQIYKNYQSSTKVAEQKVNNILSGNVDETDPSQKVASEIVNSGVIPASPEAWDNFFKGMDQINKESALLESNLITSLKRDQEASQLAYQEEVANFVNSAFPEVEKYQQELQDQVNNGQLDADQANQLFQVYKDKIQQKETELYDKWNKKINADAQRKIKMIYESREQKVKGLLEGTVLQGVDLTNVDKEYIDQSTKAFSDLVMGEMGRLEQSQSEFLNIVSYDNYMNKGWGDKIATELGRGVLQMGDSMGGLIGFLGGFEAQNTFNDALARYNAANPQYNSGSIKMSDFTNPDFYITNLVPQLPMAVVFTGLAIGTGGAAGGVAAEAGISGLGRTAIMGVSGAYASRPFESALEAGADFNEQIKNGVAVEVAAKNSADTFNQNMNLLFTDIGQLMLAFTPLGKIKGIGAAVLKAPAEALIQGGEEIYQGYVTQHNPYQTLLDYAFSPQGIKEGVIGGMMGMAYSAPDVAAQFSGRTDKWKQNLLYEMLQAPDMGKRYEDVLQGLTLLKERGQIDEQTYTDAISKLEFAYTKGHGIPMNLPIEQKTHMLGILSDINVLEQQKAQMTDQTQIKTHESLIKDLQKQYEETLSGKTPLYFVGKVSFSKEEFEQLIQNPDVVKQLAEKSTTFKVINDEGVLGETNNLIKQYEDSQNRERPDDSVIEGGSTDEGQFDTRTSPEENAAIDKVEQQDQVEEDLLEEDFPVEEYEPTTFEGPTTYERALDDVTLYAAENKIDLSEEQLEEVAAIFDENPDANIQHIIEDVTSPVLYETTNGRYQYVKTDEGIKLLDSSGKEAKLSSKQRIVYDREFASNVKLSKQDEQLLDEYLQEEDLIKQTTTDEDIIGEILSSGIKQSDWERYGDKKKTTGSMQQSSKKSKLKEIEGKFKESTGVSIQRFTENPYTKRDDGLLKEKTVDTDASIEETKREDTGKITPPPPPEKVEEKLPPKPPEKKESKFTKTVKEATTGISDEVKKQFKGTYEVKTVKETATSSTEAWEQIKSRNETLEDAVSEGEKIVNDLNWPATPLERGALAGVIAKEFNTLREQEGLSIEQINDYDQRAVELFSQVRKILTEAGQTGSVLGKFMKDYYLSYPAGISDFVNTSLDQYNDGVIGRPSPEVIMTIKEMMDKLLTSEEGLAAIEDYVTQKYRIKKKYASKKQVADEYWDSWLKEYEKSIKEIGPTAVAIPGLPQVVIIGAKALKTATKLGLGVAEAVELAIVEIKKSVQDFNEKETRAWLEFMYKKGQKTIDRRWNKEESISPIKTFEQMVEEEYQKRVERFNKAKEKFETATEDEVKKAVDERWKAEREKDEFEEAMNNLKGDKLSKFVYKIAFERANGKKTFSDQDILRAYQQVNGGRSLSPREQAIIAKNSKIISESWDEKISQQEWFSRQYKAAQAATKIQEILSKRGWYDLISSAMAAGFLGPKTLLANVVANLLNKTYQSVWEDTIFSFTDILYAPGDKRSIQERAKSIFKTEGTKEYVKTVPTAIKQSAKQMIEGVPTVTNIGEFSKSYQMRPLDAWRRLTDDLSSDASFLNKMNEVAKDAYEGTVGFVHAAILRALSAGDTLFRTPEQAKFNQKFADELEVPLDIFLTDKKYEGYREVSEKLAARLTFQNTSPLSFAYKRIKPQMSERHERIAKWLGLTLAKPIVPYVNTPINVKYEMLTMLPIFALPEFYYRHKNSLDTKLSPEDRLYNKKLAQKLMRRMVGSVPIWLAISTLLTSKVIEFVDVDEEDKKDPKTRGNLLYFQGSPIKMKVNLPGLEGQSYDAMKLGPIFDLMYIIDQTNKAYQETEGSLAETFTIFLGKNIKGTVEQTFFTGLNNIFKAYETGQWNRILIDTYGQAYTNVILPATMNYLTQLADDEKVLRLTKDEDFLTELFNKTVRKRLGFLEVEGINIEELPPVYNVMGEPVKTNETGAPDWLHFMFDFTRAEISDPGKRPNVYIFKQWEKTKNSDWLAPVPPRNFIYDPPKEGKLNKVNIKLGPVLKNEYQRVLGGEVNRLLQELFAKNPEPSLEKVEKLYEKAQKNTKRLFYEEFKEKLGSDK